MFEVFPYIAEMQGWDLKEAFALATRFARELPLVTTTGKFHVRLFKRTAESVFQCQYSRLAA